MKGSKLGRNVTDRLREICVEVADIGDAHKLAENGPFDVLAKSCPACSDTRGERRFAGTELVEYGLVGQELGVANVGVDDSTRRRRATGRRRRGPIRLGRLDGHRR